MRYSFVLLLLAFAKFCNGQAAGKTLTYIKVSGRDTSSAFTVKNDRGWNTFLFPEVVSEPIYILTDSTNFTFDTLIQKHTPSFGPYKFKKRGDVILFSSPARGKKYYVLYKLSFKKFFAPELFSSSLDSYNSAMVLIDAGAMVKTQKDSVLCFKFSKTDSYHNRSLFSQLYIAKTDYLPRKIVYFADNTFTTIKYEIIADF